MANLTTNQNMPTTSIQGENKAILTPSLRKIPKMTSFEMNTRYPINRHTTNEKFNFSFENDGSVTATDWQFYKKYPSEECFSQADKLKFEQTENMIENYDKEMNGILEKIDTIQILVNFHRRRVDELLNSLTECANTVNKILMDLQKCELEKRKE